MDKICPFMSKPINFQEWDKAGNQYLVNNIYIQPCIKEKCMAWVQHECTVSGDIVKNGCALIDKSLV